MPVCDACGRHLIYIDRDRDRAIGLDVDLGGEFGHVARARVYLRGWMHAARARVCVWVYMGGLGGGVWVRVRTRRVRACVRACVVLV